MGSGWAFEAVAYSPEAMVSLESLNRVLTYVTDPAAGALLSPTTSGGRTLVHVEAGITVARLNDELASRGLAMPTLGGANGQTLVGALSTSTHGADFAEPPFCDLVHAVHLVGVGGQEYWLERESQPITASGRLGRVLPCRDCLVVRDDELFDAVIVGLGRFGIIYSLIVETVPAYSLARSSVVLSRTTVAAMLRQGIAHGSFLDPLLAILPPPPTALNADSPQPRAMELVFDTRNPDNVHVVRRWRATGPPLDAEFKENPVCKAGSAAVIQIAAAALPVLGMDPLAVKNPLVLLDPTRPFRLSAKQIELSAALADHPTPGEALALVTNAYWEFELSKPLDLLALVVYHGQFPDQRAPSYVVMTGDPAFAQSTCYRANSCEIMFDAADGRFVDYVEFLATVAPNYNQAGYISLRFSRSSRALLSMHGGEFARAVSIEVSTLKGLSDAAAWVDFALAQAFAFGGRPHWGQQNDFQQAQLQLLYGTRLDRWRAALGGFSGASTLFSTPFTVARGLEPQGSRPPRIEGRAWQLAGSGVQAAITLLLDPEEQPTTRLRDRSQAAVLLLT